MLAFPALDLACLISSIKLATLNAFGKGMSTKVQFVGPLAEEIVPILLKLVALSLLPNNSSGSPGVSPPLEPLPRITLILTVLISDFLIFSYQIVIFLIFS